MPEPVIKQLRRVRWQLALLYSLAAFALVALVGGGSYFLLRYYFQYTTDLALNYRMAQVFRQYGQVVPSELSVAEQTWLAGMPVSDPAAGQVQQEGRKVSTSSEEHAEDGEDGADNNQSDDEDNDHLAEAGQAAGEPEKHDREAEEVYDGQLAAVFFLPVNDLGEPVVSATSVSPPIAVDRQTLQAALERGFDLRTLRLTSGGRVRLLTYRAAGEAGPAFFQVGRLLNDQDRVAGLYLVGLLGLGSAAVFLLGAGGWWLSGRTFRPAQQAWDQQQAFVSNASHELRTPLTLIRASADYGLRTRDPGLQQQALQDIVQECDYMNSLVDDLLLLSRLDTGRLQLDLQPINLDAFLPEILVQMQNISAQKGITLELKDARGTIVADPTRLRQVLLILLDNALTYTPQGQGIWLGSQPLGKQVEIVVTDSGTGIPAEHLPHVFERFYQASRPGVDQSRSNGLGLSIARALVEAQHGKIEIASQEGQGTTVRLRFPA